MKSHRTRRTLIGSLALAIGAFLVPGAAVLATASEASATVTVTKLTQAQAESMFRAAGVTWSSSGGCTSQGNPTCTSFSGLNLATAQGAVTLKKASGCAVNITGGTEVGHASGTFSHANGYKLDFSHNSCLDGYIHNAFTRIANRGDGFPQWKAASGNIYCDEGSHWDVTFFSCGC